MVKFHTVALSSVEREFLHRTISAGTAPPRVTKRARVLLKADAGDDGPGWGDAAIADAVEVSIPTIERLRKRAVAEGIETALTDRPRPLRPGKLDGAQEARLTALACSLRPPDGSAGRLPSWWAASRHSMAERASPMRRSAKF